MAQFRCSCGKVFRTRAGAVMHVTVAQKDGKSHNIRGI